MSDSLQPHGLQHTRLPCPSPTPGACSNSCSSSWWCHPTMSSSVIPLSFCLQSFPASGSFPRSQFYASGGQSTGVSASASVLPMNIQDWFPLGLTGWISLPSKIFLLNITWDILGIKKEREKKEKIRRARTRIGNKMMKENIICWRKFNDKRRVWFLLW